MLQIFLLYWSIKKINYYIIIFIFLSTEHHDFLRVAKGSMSCHKIVPRCHTTMLIGFLDCSLIVFDFVSFLVNSCQFSFPTIFIKFCHSFSPLLIFCI